MQPVDETTAGAEHGIAAEGVPENPMGDGDQPAAEGAPEVEPQKEAAPQGEAAAIAEDAPAAEGGEDGAALARSGAAIGSESGSSRSEGGAASWKERKKLKATIAALPPTLRAAASSSVTGRAMGIVQA